MRVRYQIGESRAPASPAPARGQVLGLAAKQGAARTAPAVARERSRAAAARRRADPARRLPALGATAAVLFVAAGCASLDPVAKKAWSIEPVLDIQHSAIAAQGHYAVGRYLDGMRAWDKAAAAYQRAVAADPRHAEAHNGLGVALARLGRHEEAERALRRAVEIDPQRAHLHSNLGFMMLKAGRLSEALTALKAAVTLDPADATARGNLREAVAQAENARIAADLSAPAEPTPALASNTPAKAAVAPDVAPDQALEAPGDKAAAHVISVPAPITAASLPTPIAGPVDVPAPLGSMAVQATQVAVFDQPTIAAWPRSGEPPASSFQAMSKAAPARGAEAAGRAFPPAPTGPAVAMPVRLSTLSLPVLLAPAISRPAQWSEGVRLELSNGNGVRGMAAQLGEWLSRHGMKTTRLTNSRPFVQQYTTVEYGPGHEGAAWQVVHALPRTTHAEPVLRQGLKVDVRVVLGLDWRSACVDPDACPPTRTTVAAAQAAR